MRNSWITHYRFTSLWLFALLCCTFTSALYAQPGRKRIIIGLLPVIPTVDTTVVQFIEEFPSTALGSGSIATHGWSFLAIGGAPIPSFEVGVFPHLGIFRLATAAVITQGGEFYLGFNGVTLVGLLNANSNWDSIWIFRINQNTDIRFRIGYQVPTVAVAQPPDGIWLRFDTSAGFADANWQFCARAAAGAETCFNTAVAADTNWHRVRIRSTQVGTVRFTLDNGTERSICAAGCDANGALPAVTLTPEMIIVTDLAATARSADVDFWGFVASGLIR